MKKALVQINEISETLKRIKLFAINYVGGGLSGLMGKLDTLTAEHTAFKNFTALLNAEGGYFPSINKAPDDYKKTELYRTPTGRNVTAEQLFVELDLLLRHGPGSPQRPPPRLPLLI